jgi:hypothetical protein
MQPSRAKVRTICGARSAHLNFIVRDLQHYDNHRRRTYIHCLSGPSYPTLLKIGHFTLFCPRFLWAHRSGNTSPFRPVRLLLWSVARTTTLPRLPPKRFRAGRRPWFPTGLLVAVLMVSPRSGADRALGSLFPFGRCNVCCFTLNWPVRKISAMSSPGPRHDATFKPFRPLGSLVGASQRISSARLPAPVSFPSSDIRPLFVHSSLFFFLRFLGLTAPAIPVRSGLRVFCFLGSTLDTIGSPPECRR